MPCSAGAFPAEACTSLFGKRHAGKLKHDITPEVWQLILNRLLKNNGWNNGNNAGLPVKDQ